MIWAFRQEGALLSAAALLLAGVWWPRLRAVLLREGAVATPVARVPAQSFCPRVLQQSCLLSGPHPWALAGLPPKRGPTFGHLWLPHHHPLESCFLVSCPAWGELQRTETLSWH